VLVTFQRTGRRRYRVEVRRPPFAAVEMNPAPGYDDLMLPTVSADKLKQIFHHLDELSLYWSRLNIGDSMTIQWPDLSVSPVDDQ